MPHDKLVEGLGRALGDIDRAGTGKRDESVIAGFVPGDGTHGPRYLLEGHGDTPFLRMNANSYLGLSLRERLIDSEDEAVHRYGTGPGAVRFISGTWAPHRHLEERIAAFHGREAAMIYSSAYATVMGVLPQLITGETAVISDALNHNSIINAIRLARPKEKAVYAHLDMEDLDRKLAAAAKGDCKRAIVVTDGIFSMRGDHAPLDEIMRLAEHYDGDFAENVLVVVDDSHGVGAFGTRGRGVEEFTLSPPVDILIATLGKAFGVNGGYVTAGRTIIDYLRETSPFYIYSNPITPGEAAAAQTALDLVDSPRGLNLLDRLRRRTAQLKAGFVALGWETIPGEHPVAPLLVHDTRRTMALVEHLREHRILATGLGYPVVPRGDEEIRFQVSADHTEADIEQALDAVRQFSG